MHSIQVIHKDIKKENILIIDNSFVLADFGLSSRVEDLEKSFISGHFLLESELAGTPLYMSPLFKQKYKSKSYLFKSDLFKNDIYALGLIFLEIMMIKNDYSRNQILQILSSPDLAYLEA